MDVTVPLLSVAPASALQVNGVDANVVITVMAPVHALETGVMGNSLMGAWFVLRGSMLGAVAVIKSSQSDGMLDVMVSFELFV